MKKLITIAALLALAMSAQAAPAPSRIGNSALYDTGSLIYGFEPFGIGTAAPVSALQVVGTATMTDAILTDPTIVGTAGYASISSTGQIGVGTMLPVANGGTGGTSSNAALDNLYGATNASTNPLFFSRYYNVNSSSSSYVAQNTYGINLDAKYLPHLRLAMARVKSGTGRGLIVRVGDSTTIGINASGIANWPNQGAYLASYLTARGIPAFQNSFVGNSQGTGLRSNVDTRIALNSWASNSNLTLGGYMFAATATGTPFAYTPTTPIDTCKALYLSINTSGPTGTLQAGSGSTVPLNENQPQGNYTATATAATPAIQSCKASFTSGSTLFLQGMIAYDSTIPAIDLVDAGWWGSILSQAASASGAFSPQNVLVALKPDAVILKMDINDGTSGTAVSAYLANLNAFIQALQAAGVDVILETDNPTTNNNQGPYVAAMYQAAIVNNVPLIDLYSVQSYAQNSAIGYMSDTVHPNSMYYSDMASQEGAFLTAVAGGGTNEVASISPELIYTGGLERLRVTNAGLVGIGTTTPAYPLDVAGISRSTGLISGGATFTASGCALTSPAGGATVGKFLSGTSGTCTVTITLPTASNGWHCKADDETSGVRLNTTADTATSCTVSGTTASGDKVVFDAIGY